MAGIQFINYIFRKFNSDYSESDSESKSSEQIYVKLYVDNVKTKSNDGHVFGLPKKSKLSDLKAKAKKASIDTKDLYWWIDNKFWSEETTFDELTKQMKPDEKKQYLVYGIQIPAEQIDEIDYNLDLFLSQKYGTSSKSEEFVDVAQEVNENDKLDNFVEPEISDTVCEYCRNKCVASKTVKFVRCSHQCCITCMRSIFEKNHDMILECPVENCKSFLLDHEIQMSLNNDQYSQFSNYMMCHTTNKKPLPRVGWLCAMCTYINPPYRVFCDTCQTNRPARYITPAYWEPSPEDTVAMQAEMQLHRQDMDLSGSWGKDSVNNLKELAKKPIWFTREECECPICIMDVPAGEAIILRSCMHTVCKSCLRTYLQNIEQAKVKCPTEECMELLEDLEIRELLNSKEYRQYQEMSMRIAEATETNAYHCRGVNCTAWIVRDDVLREFKCPRCLKTNCIQCMAIHEGITCEQYIKVLASSKDTDSQMNDLYIHMMINSGQAMKCPGCSILVEKTRGCDGVTCKSCGIMMCWATKGPRWGPKGKGDTSGGCGCRYFLGSKCHPSCNYCH